MLEARRLEAACRELAAGTTALKHVAAQCGFRDVQTLRRALQRRLGAVPSEITELAPWLQRLHARGRLRA